MRCKRALAVPLAVRLLPALLKFCPCAADSMCGVVRAKHALVVVVLAASRIQ